MNDKLKQSLQGRLSGMRWGEREQAEVFRQIQRKEMQEVKHVKRGTSMLALAAAMLFLLMGAAFALTGAGHPDDTTPLSQPTENNFVPTPVARVETDFCILTITDAQWIGEELTIDLLLQLREPEKYGLIISSYANPGSASRTMLAADFLCRCVIVEDGQPINAYLSNTDVLDMTAASATVRLTLSDIVTERDAMDVYIDFTAQADYIRHTASLDFTAIRAAVSQNRNSQWLFENELITGYLAEIYATDDHLILSVDVVPRKPWYIINADAADKSTMNVTAQWYAGDDGETSLTAVNVLRPEFLPTVEGARCTVAIPFPAEHQSIQFHGNVTAQDAVSGTRTSGRISMIFTRPEAQAPTPAPTPAPLERSEPKGEHIGGTELVSVYLEDYWFDGFSAEGTLRIRADDAQTCRLALTPNEGDAPSERTWVVRIDDDDRGTYLNDLDYTLSMEEATGDVIMSFAYCDLYHYSSNNPQNPRYQDLSLYQDFTISVTNELTWETDANEVNMVLTPNGEYDYHPLYLVSTTSEGAFVQAGYITSDRYHYVGVMKAYDNYYVPLVLTDAAGNVLGSSDSSRAAPSNSFLSFPMKLFPYNENDDLHFTFSAVRIDKAIELPELLYAKYESQHTTDLPSFVLALTPGAAVEAAQHQSVSIVLDQNLLFSNDYMSIRFVNADFTGGHATAHLTATISDPSRFSFVPTLNNPEEVYLEPQLSFFDLSDSSALQSGAECFTVFSECYSPDTMDFYIHGSSDAWREAAPHLLARLTIMAEGSGQHTYTSEFTFPATGHVDCYTMEPAENVDSQMIEFLSGEFIATRDCWIVDFQYRLTDPEADEFFHLGHFGTEINAPMLLSSHDSNDPTLRRAKLFTHPLGEVDQAQLSLFIMSHTGQTFRSELPFTLTPITE